MVRLESAPVHSFVGLPGVAGILILSSLVAFSGCKPDESPLKLENDQLRKQVAKQETVIQSMQDGNKVMQQQIDLLNQELREAKQGTERAKAGAKESAQQLEAVKAENRKVAAEAQRSAAKMAQVTKTLLVEDKGGQSRELLLPLAAVSQAAEEVLSRNGYTLRVGIKTDHKAVYVTDRKVSAPASLEVSGFRNQYLVSLTSLPTTGTLLSVKADFEKTAQGGRIIAVGPEETAEIERRLIAEISTALAKDKAKM